MPSTKRVSHRGSLLKGVAVYRALYQSILNAKLTGRKNLGRKRCTSNRDDCKLENTVKQSWFKHLWELHKEWTEAGVSASRVTTLRRLQEKGYQQGRFLTTIEGWAGRYPGWALGGWGGGGGGGRLDIYTVDIAILIILTIVCYMYTGEKRKKKL